MQSFKKGIKLVWVGLLVVMFNNCGEGFKSARLLSQNSVGLSTPSPSQSPNPSPSTTPNPSATLTPRPSATPTATPPPTPTPPRIPPDPDGIPGVRPAPNWVGSLPVGQWQVVSLNKLYDVNSATDPDLLNSVTGRPFGIDGQGNYVGSEPWHGTEGISGIMDDWSGGAMASNYGAAGALVVWGGGHGGYAGSDIYGFDLAERKWKRISNPYGSAPGDRSAPSITSSIGTFPDGSPINPHTYDTLEYQPTTNTFFTFTAYTSTPGTTHLSIAHLLNLDHTVAANYRSSMWRRSNLNIGVVNGMTGSILEGGMSCYDRKRDGFWIWEPPRESNNNSPTGFNNRFSYFDPNVTNSDGTTGEYSNYMGDGSGFGSSNGFDCDPKRDIAVFVQFSRGAASNVYYRDLTTPGVLSKRIPNITGSPSVVARMGGFEYSDLRDSMVYWNGGPDVYELRISSSPERTPTAAQWSKISNGSVSPEMNMNGVYSRFRIARFNQNGNLIEVAITVGNVGKTASTGFVYAMRLP